MCHHEIMIMVVFVLVIWLYKSHIYNYHNHQNNLRQPRKTITYSPNALRIIFVIASLLITVAGIFIIIAVKDHAVLAAAIWIFSTIALVDYLFEDFSRHKYIYKEIVEPAIMTAEKEVNINILQVHIYLTKSGKTLTANINDNTNKVTAIKTLAHYGLIDVESANIGHMVVVRSNDLYRREIRHYYKKYHNKLYNTTNKEAIDDWLSLKCTNENQVLNENFNINTKCTAPPKTMFSNQRSTDFIFFCGLLEIIAVAISFFSNKFSTDVLFAAIVFSSIMMMTGYTHAKNKKNILSVAGFILTIISTITSIIALVVSLFSIVATAQQLI